MKTRHCASTSHTFSPRFARFHGKVFGPETDFRGGGAFACCGRNHNENCPVISITRSHIGTRTHTIRDWSHTTATAWATGGGGAAPLTAPADPPTSRPPWTRHTTSDHDPSAAPRSDGDGDGGSAATAMGKAARRLRRWRRRLGGDGGSAATAIRTATDGGSDGEGESDGDSERATATASERWRRRLGGDGDGERSSVATAARRHGDSGGDGDSHSDGDSDSDVESEGEGEGESGGGGDGAGRRLGGEGGSGGDLDKGAEPVRDHREGREENEQSEENV